MNTFTAKLGHTSFCSTPYLVPCITW